MDGVVNLIRAEFSGVEVKYMFGKFWDVKNRLEFFLKTRM